MTFETCVLFEAPPDDLFGAMATRDQWNDWLPGWLQVEPSLQTISDVVWVRNGVPPNPFQVSISPHVRRLAWIPADRTNGWGGSVVVTPRPAGTGSISWVRLTPVGDTPALSPDRLESIVQLVAGRLRDRVEHQHDPHADADGRSRPWETTSVYKVEYDGGFPA